MLLQNLCPEMIIHLPLLVHVDIVSVAHYILVVEKESGKTSIWQGSWFSLNSVDF